MHPAGEHVPAQCPASICEGRLLGIRPSEVSGCKDRIGKAQELRHKDRDNEMAFMANPLLQRGGATS